MMRIMEEKYDGSFGFFPRAYDRRLVDRRGSFCRRHPGRL
jgi:hypothetical protein